MARNNPRFANQACSDSQALIDESAILISGSGGSGTLEAAYSDRAKEVSDGKYKTAANLYAAYEVALFRKHNVLLTCAVSFILPVVGPIVFLSVPGSQQETPALSAVMLVFGSVEPRLIEGQNFAQARV